MQIHAKSFFLTYPRCAVPAETFRVWVESTFKPNYLVIGSELHEDGTPHIHICFTLDEALRTRDPRCFDFQGHHPNIVRPRNIPKCITYVKKGGVFLEVGVPPEMKRKWSELSTATSKEDFMSTALQVSARDYYINHERLEYVAAKLFKPAAPVYAPTFTNFTIPEELSEWCNQRKEVCWSLRSCLRRTPPVGNLYRF